MPAGARVFGDLEEIKKKALDEGGFQLAPENGTNPSVWYIPNNVVEAGEAKSQNWVVGVNRESRRAC